jgi:hypothetical protein
VLNDVNNFLTSGQMKTTENLPCNATVDSTSVSNDTITYFITYSGLSCNHKFNRNGQVEIRKKVGTHWWQAGATVIVNYKNLAITRVLSGKTLTLNGHKMFENVTGGLIPQLGGQFTSITHHVQGYVTATFDDNSTRVWNIAREKTFTGSFPDNLVMTENGFGSAGSYTNLATWGLNRQNEEFYISISQPVVYRQVCTWDPCSGVKTIEIPSKSKGATTTFGYDSNNQPVTNGDCPTKFKVDWHKNGNSGTIYLFLL